MSICAKITAGNAINCDFPLTGGVKDRLILVNYEDWQAATLTKNVSNPQIIENIVLTAPAVGYVFEGQNNSIEPQANLVRQRYTNVYDHEVMFQIFNVSPAAKKEAEKLANGKVVAIIENNFKNSTGNMAYEVYGSEVGLNASELKRVLADADTQGAISVILKTPENGGKETHLPATIFDTDYAATRTVVNSIL
jgi:hypothetical protein